VAKSPLFILLIFFCHPIGFSRTLSNERYKNDKFFKETALPEIQDFKHQLLKVADVIKMRNLRKNTPSMKVSRT
jgi:hypothetical protein